jgi:hypothetical protein
VTTTVRETATARTGDTRDRILVTLATPGWGSSGYYSPQVLEAAAGDQVFPAGTPCHVDHPRRSDDVELPERSVETMAAVLAEDARWDAATGELVAEAKLFPHKAWLADMAGSIGMSIIADADVREAEVEGRSGRVIERLVQGRSVDFVTKAGRGGRFSVAESARPEQVERRAVRAGVAEATVEDTRQALSEVVRAEHGGTDGWAYVEDFDDTTVWFSADGPDGSATWQQTYSGGSTGAVALTGEPTQVRRRTTYVPVTESGRNTQEGAPMPTISESEHTRLTEAERRVPALEAERDQATQRATAAESERDQAREQLAGLQRADAARPVIESVLAESEVLADATRARVARESLRELPVTESGDLDEAKLRDQVKAAREAAETEVGAYVSEAGQPRGLGSTVHESAKDDGPDEFAGIFSQPIGA